jgi:hypothetical protein
MESENMQYVNVSRNYEEAFKTKPFYHTDVRCGIENIVDREEGKHEKVNLENVFSAKAKSMKASIKAFADEIILREKLDLHLLGNIDENMIRQQSKLDHLKYIKIHYSSELEKDINNRKMELENNVLELEKEKRKEYLECWKDLMSLKKYLLMALKDFWDVSKRRGVFGKES